MEFLLSSVVLAALPIVVIAIVGLVLFIFGRRQAIAAADGTKPSTTGAIARVIAILAFVYGLLAVFAAFVATVVSVSATTQGGRSPDPVTLPVPVSVATEIPESVLPPFEIGAQAFVIASFSEVSIPGAILSPGTAILYFAPLFLTPVLHAIVAFGISSLATRIERNEGFAPQLTKSAIIVGTSLIVIGSLSQAMQLVGTNLARNELLGGTELDGFVGAGPLDLTHVAAGVGVLLVAVLLRRGTQLQRDTAGLV